MNKNFKQSLLACAILQAFAVHAQTQTGNEPITEVVITGAKQSGGIASVGGFGNSAVIDTPASISTIDAQKMQDLSIRSATEAMKYDASVSDSYNAVGYAEQFAIRGFALDNDASYRKNGIAIPNDTQIPLENKERIEVLKGLSGLQAGVTAPGGIINFVTKRPTNKDLRSATVEVSERGTLYGAVDLGGRFQDRRFGYRINAAAEDIHPYVRGANGSRQFVSGAFDWQISPDALLQLDFDYQHKSQKSAPGFQLIRNEVLPTGVSPKMFLGDQAWARPVDTKSTNLGLHFEYKLGAGWLASVDANKHWFKRDDFTAFPYGCSTEGEGFYPGYCSNGDMDIYDYISTGERKTPWGAQAQVQGKFATGQIAHAVTFGTSYYERHNAYGDYVYDFVGTSNFRTNAPVPPVAADRVTGPVSERLHDQERALYAQDIVNVAPKTTLHAGARWVNIKRNQFIDASLPFAKSDDSFVLPNVALVYALTPNWNVYGSVSQGMEHGGVAPMQTTNQNQVLGPSRSHQAELGVKGVSSEALTLTAALFQIRKGLEYTNAANTFVRNGEETHRGIELDASGKLDANLAYSLSLQALNTRQQGSGDATIDGKRVADVPAFKSVAWMEYSVPQVAGLKVDGSWSYTGKKAFDVENRVFVPGYHVFGLGTSYALRTGLAKVTLRARVDNVFDRFYWRDVTPELGGYLFPGAPRTFRVSAQFDF
ncbi:TonB-dependent siderophore receptor [Massilia terrae]|uniref:TonB-dependent siderophore receptor n=1 Tax=Massilia terrae TaxID=1811224 RepID=A0ABT2CSS6_9BURK|nr:TonB-dependent siderophore receptor [Massilia terrae]MCS0656631.1 TonB-dependent siderophore receptor [Massilia terrae]